MVDLFMVFDVESVGLHGEGFAVGAVVIDRRGALLDQLLLACEPNQARGTEAGREWIHANVPDLNCERLRNPQAVRSRFWAFWQQWRARGAVLAADCAWPVEARFLAACVDDDPEVREWEGPYPLHDIASIRLATGLDPLGTLDRQPDELPVHDALADARQSARLLVEALETQSPEQGRSGESCGQGPCDPYGVSLSRARL